MLKRSLTNFFFFFFFFLSFLTDKLTKEEEEIYKLQLDLDRMAISQQQSKKISEVSSSCLNIQQRWCCRCIRWESGTLQLREFNIRLF